MKHCLKAKYIVTEDNEIKDAELLNLINEREEIKAGTQVVVKRQGKEVLLEVVEIQGNKVWWQIV